jgi:uncharacterized glyoxalase superfamily protein PhnB
MALSSSEPPTVSPYLVVEDATAVIAFAKAAFGAEEVDRRIRPDGSVAAASIRIGTSVVMMTEREDAPFGPALIHVYVDDLDVVYHRAVEAGAVSLAEPSSGPDGERRAGVQGPSGTQWWLSTLPKTP